MRNSLLFILLLSIMGLNAQQPTTGKLNPGESYTNQSGEVVFYMPRAKVIKLLDYQTKAEFDSMRVEQYKALVKNMQLRIVETDSAVSLRNYEASYWKMQLENNDRELEKVRIDKETLHYENMQLRKSRFYFLLGGIVATSVLFVVAGQ